MINNLIQCYIVLFAIDTISHFLNLYLSQRAWLLKLLAIALHTGSGSSSAHLEACQSILSHLFGREVTEAANEIFSASTYPQDGVDYAGTSSISKSKVSLETPVFYALLCFMAHPSFIPTHAGVLHN